MTDPYLLSFTVQAVEWDGTPVIPGPQGSKTPTGAYRLSKAGKKVPILRESSKKVAPWREAVANTCDATIAALPPAERRRFPLDGPLVGYMVVTLARTTAANRADAPTTYPDLSKLCRSTEDALTGKLWADDARLVGYDTLWKTYPGRHTHALTGPGAYIAVRRATHTEIGLDPTSRQGLKYTDLINRWNNPQPTPTLFKGL